MPNIPREGFEPIIVDSAEAARAAWKLSLKALEIIEDAHGLWRNDEELPPDDWRHLWGIQLSASYPSSLEPRWDEEELVEDQE